MSNKILEANRIKEGNELVQYDFTFQIEDKNDIDRKNIFCVTIFASEMDSPTSKAEAKTKAINKAKEIYKQFIKTKKRTAENLADQAGDVSVDEE